MFSVWQELLCLLRYICLVVEGCLYNASSALGSVHQFVFYVLFLSLTLALLFSLFGFLFFISLSLFSSCFCFSFWSEREREKKTVVVVGKQGGRERLYLAFEYFLRAFRFKSPSLFLYISNCATGYVGGNLERVFVQLWRYTAKARQEKRGCTPVSIKVHRPVNLGND